MHSTDSPKCKTLCLWTLVMICWELETWQVREDLFGLRSRRTDFRFAGLGISERLKCNGQLCPVCLLADMFFSLLGCAHPFLNQRRQSI
jgi:hypothetical protein